MLAPKGVKVRQRVQIRYEWAYLLLGVDPLAGALRWQWLARMRQEQLRPVLEAWALDGVVWDRAGAHRGKRVQELALERVFLPPYSPELNAIEPTFRAVKHLDLPERRYATAAALAAAVDEAFARVEAKVLAQPLNQPGLAA